jgi:hypothetical protein
MAPPPLVSKAALMAVPTSQKRTDIFAFLRSNAFTASSADVFQGLVKGFSDPALQEEFSAKIKEETANTLSQFHYVMDPDNARTNALFDVIMAHREDFPPEEFTIGTTYASGAWGTTTIPSAADAAAEKAAQRQADYTSTIGARATTQDKDSAKLDALEQAVSTLVLNSQQVVDQSVADARAAYAILTQKLFSDDEDSASEASVQTAEEKRYGSGRTARSMTFI